MPSSARLEDQEEKYNPENIAPKSSLLPWL